MFDLPAARLTFLSATAPALLYLLHPCSRACPQNCRSNFAQHSCPKGESHGGFHERKESKRKDTQLVRISCASQIIPAVPTRHPYLDVTKTYFL